MKTKLLLLLLLSSIPAFAQYEYRPGYIIKTDGTTEYGLINFHGSDFNVQKCDFKKDSASSSIRYKPFDIKAYRLTDSKYFISKKAVINKDTIDLFLECLISGKASVFYAQWNSKDYFFLEKDNKLIELENSVSDLSVNGNDYQRVSKKYRGQLKYYLREDANLYSKIDRADLSKKSLIEIAKKYHEDVCTDEQCIVYEKKSVKKHIRWGIDFSWCKTSFNFSQSNLFFSFKSADLFQFGLNAQIQLDEEGAFNLEPLIGYYSYEGSLLNNSKAIDYASEPNDIHYKFSLLKPAIQLKYVTKIWNMNPYISAGLFSTFFLSEKGYIYSQPYKQNISFSSAGLETNGKIWMIGGRGELGVEKRLKPIGYSLSVFYERYLTNPFTKTYNAGIKIGFFLNN
jgi:hypothetical protein